MEAAGAEAFAVDQQFTLTRTFDAPRELVFEVWTEAKHFVQWFGPPGVEIRFCKLDARPGGTLHFCHRAEGVELWIRGVYREVVAPSRLVFDLRFVDPEGNPASPRLLPDFPIDGMVRTTVTFEDQGGKTKLTVHQRVTSQKTSAREAVARERKMAREGWDGTLDRLAGHLAAELPRRQDA